MSHRKDQRKSRARKHPTKRTNENSVYVPAGSSTKHCSNYCVQQQQHIQYFYDATPCMLLVQMPFFFATIPTLNFRLNTQLQYRREYASPPSVVGYCDTTRDLHHKPSRKAFSKASEKKKVKNHDGNITSRIFSRETEQTPTHSESFTSVSSVHRPGITRQQEVGGRQEAAHTLRQRIYTL